MVNKEIVTLILKDLQIGSLTQKQIAEKYNLKIHQVEYIARKEYMNNYYEEHKEKILRDRKEYQVSHKTEIKERKRIYQQKHKAEISAKGKVYRETHKEQRNKHERERREKDPNYRILTNLRKRIGLAVNSQNARKLDRTLNLLGCDYEFFHQYLENQFRDGMTWENYGKVWQVDHIIPCAAFDLTKEEEQRKCFHYTNLQPLLTEENYAKNDFLPNGKRARYSVS